MRDIVALLLGVVLMTGLSTTPATAAGTGGFAFGFTSIEGQPLLLAQLFSWLRGQLGQDVGPGWNFHKYLIGPDGRAVAAWPSAVELGSVEIGTAIETVLPRPAS
jgi:hypothetical protein